MKRGSVLFMALIWPLFLAEAQIKVVNGRNATRGEIPFQVSLDFFDNPNFPFSHLCGGSIVDSDWIVTAAHCCRWGSPDIFHVVAGMLDKSNTNGEIDDRQYRRVVDLVEHPSYNESNHDNDICLLRLDLPLMMNEVVQPAVLATFTPETGRELAFSGWGRLEEGAIISATVLQVAYTEVYDHTNCSAIDFATGQVANDNFICCYKRIFDNGVDVGGVDTCGGDSGGPLFDPMSRKVHGLVSGGEGCARPQMPKLFTDISKYLGWIHDTIGL